MFTAPVQMAWPGEKPQRAQSARQGHVPLFREDSSPGVLSKKRLTML
jgi:hypothetical protein